MSTPFDKSMRWLAMSETLRSQLPEDLGDAEQQLLRWYYEQAVLTRFYKDAPALLEVDRPRLFLGHPAYDPVSASRWADRTAVTCIAGAISMLLVPGANTLVYSPTAAMAQRMGETIAAYVDILKAAGHNV